MPHRRRGERLHHGGDVCGIVVLGSMVLSVLFLLEESHVVGVFCSRRNP